VSKAIGAEGALKRTSAKGLATLALLKANFDLRKDHIGMFMPFVIDAIANLGASDFDGTDVRDEIRKRHGLLIPPHTLSVLLHRAVKKSGVTREGGRYFRSSEFSIDVDIAEKRQALEADQRKVATALAKFAEEAGLPGLSEQDALALIFKFLADNHVVLALDEVEGSTVIEVDDQRQEPLGRKEARVVAQFVLRELHTDAEIAGCLKAMLEGFILQNALFLRDIGQAERKFSNLTVFLDTGLILEALGLEGEAAGIAARESFELLRETGAVLGVFEKTIDEIVRIFRVYEDRLGTSEGVTSLFPTEMTRYVVTHRLTPADMRQAISTLRRDVKALGIRVQSLPARNALYTLDEKDLSKRIRRPTESDLHPRVTHDVDAIAAVLTLRQGYLPHSLDDGRVIFATRTGALVKNTRDWFRGQEQSGLSPVVHRIALSSAAWLKKPGAAPQLKVDEMTALCAAALGPSKRLWDLFLRHLRSLRDTGTITSDEMVAVVASQLTNTLLAEIDDEVEPDARTIDEVIQRVQAEYRSREEVKTKKVEEDYNARLIQAHTAVAQAEARVKEESERRRQLELALLSRFSSWAAVLSWAFFVVAALVLVVGSTDVVLRALEGRGLVPRIVAVSILLLVWAVGMATLLWGGDLNSWRESVARWIEHKLHKYFGLGVGAGSR